MHCTHRYFVPTGNTTFGVQNMEYDSFTGDIFLAVYPGQKEHYPNFPLYVIDGKKKPSEEGVLSLKESGLYEKGVYGYRFPYGSTGMISLGDGFFYFSHNAVVDGRHCADICLYRHTGEAEEVFERVR